MMTDHNEDDSPALRYNSINDRADMSYNDG
jgi:hypothetical protein